MLELSFRFSQNSRLVRYDQGLNPSLVQLFATVAMTIESFCACIVFCN